LGGLFGNKYFATRINVIGREVQLVVSDDKVSWAGASLAFANIGEELGGKAGSSGEINFGTVDWLSGAKKEISSESRQALDLGISNSLGNITDSSGKEKFALRGSSADFLSHDGVSGNEEQNVLVEQELGWERVSSSRVNVSDLLDNNGIGDPEFNSGNSVVGGEVQQWTEGNGVGGSEVGRVG